MFMQMRSKKQPQLPVPEHTHYFQEEIEITDGFYSGHTGKVIDHGIYEDGEYYYTIKLSGDRTIVLKSRYLEGVY